MIAEANRILKNNGTLCLTTPNVISYSSVYKIITGRHPFRWSSYTCLYGDRHNREYTPFEVKKLLECGGFEVDFLKTFEWETKSWRIRAIGKLCCLPATVAGKISPKLRGSTIGVRAVKRSNVLDRFPKFLYEMYGQSKVVIPTCLALHSKNSKSKVHTND